MSDERGDAGVASDEHSDGTRIASDERSDGTRIASDERSDGTRIASDERSNSTSRDDELTPTGLVSLGRPNLVRVVALYTALTIVLLAIPALLAQPRGEPSHLSQQELTTGRTR